MEVKRLTDVDLDMLDTAAMDCAHLQVLMDAEP